MKKFFKIALWCVIGCILVGTFVYLYKNSQPEAEVYETVMPQVTDIERSTVLTGTIEPRDEIEVKPQISGIIVEINVEAGNMVKAGDVIAKIKVVPEESQLSSALSRIDNAKIALADATTRHNRNATLYDKKVISREEYEATAVEVDKARAELEAANDAYVIVRDGVSPRNASGSNTLVRATTSGLVLDVPVKVGASVIQANTFNDGTTIATIADMGNLIFKGNADETEVGNLRVGQPMEITVGALPDLTFNAVIEYISPKSSATSGANTFEVKGAVTVPEGTEVRSGYSANARVMLNSAKGTLAVPESVVEFKGDSAFVYVVADSVAHNYRRTAIETGISDGVNIEVKKGINAKTPLRGAKVENNAQ